MTTSNPVIMRIARFFLRTKIRKFLFTYEEEVYENDVIDQTYVRHYIANLRTAVDEEIEKLTEEYHL